MTRRYRRRPYEQTRDVRRTDESAVGYCTRRIVFASAHSRSSW
jgi:hypothetical protein